MTVDEFWEAHKKLIWFVLWRNLKDKQVVDECFPDVYLKLRGFVERSGGTIHNPPALATFVTNTMVLHVIADYMNKRRRLWAKETTMSHVYDQPIHGTQGASGDREDEDGQSPIEVLLDPGYEVDIAEQVTHEIMEEWVKTNTPVLYLHAYEDMTYAQIAEYLGKNKESVGGQLNRDRLRFWYRFGQFLERRPQRPRETS